MLDDRLLFVLLLMFCSVLGEEKVSACQNICDESILSISLGYLIPHKDSGGEA